MDGGTVLVTGATGFLGRHLVEAWLANGTRIRALARRPSEAGSGNARVETTYVADLSDREGVRAAVRGVETVVHLAARVHVMRETASDALAAFRAVNVEGTRVLLEEAIAAGVRRFVFVSSVKAIGEGGAEPYTEKTRPAPTDPYGVSKLEAELLVRALADRAGVHAPVLRLPLVYGPGVTANMLRLFRLVDRELPLPFGAVHNRRSLVFAGNVVAAIDAALAKADAARETFLVSDGEDLSTPDLVRAVARALGKRARLVPVPPAFFRVAGRAGDVLARIAPVPFATPAAERLMGSLAVDSSKLRRVTGFRPPYTVEEGMKRTAEWYRQSQRVTSNV